MVPLQDFGSFNSDWSSLQYKKIPANEVAYRAPALEVVVDKSASPLIYRFQQIKMISGFSWNLEYQGDLPKSSGEITEDFPFRLGLVATGEKTLNRLQRLIAADWVLKLFDLSPKGVGLDKIYFYNLGTHPKQLGQERIHPSSDLMSEKVVATLEGLTSELSFNLSRPVRAAALWISVDGDDQKKQYGLKVKSLGLQLIKDE